MNHDQLCDMLKTKPLSTLTEKEMSEARTLAYGILRADYYRDVRGLAESIKADVLDGSIKDWDALTERVHEDVDGNQRVIYTHQAKEAVILSDNGEAMLDDFGPEEIVKGDSINWSGMAFFAMQQDVWELLSAEGIDQDYWDNLEEEEDDEDKDVDEAAGAE